MKKNMIRLSAAAVSMACVTSYASLATGVNLIDNPGFEDATLAPWLAEGGGSTLSLSSLAKTGSQSARVDFTGDFDGIQQSFGLDAGDVLQEYTITCSVNTDGYSDPSIFRLGLWEFAPGGVTFNVQDWVGVPAGSSGWVDLSYTVTLSDPTADSLRATLVTAPQGSPKLPGYFVVDDFTLVKSIPEPATLSLIGAMGGTILFFRRRFMA
jgi:hypothetical protein